MKFMGNAMLETLQQSPMGAVVMDQYGFRKWHNPAYAAAYDPDAMPGFLAHIRKQDPRLMLQIIDTIYNGQSWSGELVELCGGEARHVLVSISPLVLDSESKDRAPHYLALVSDVTNYKQKLAESQDNAMRDKLTGLANRAHYEAAIDISIKQVRRSKHLNALLLIDLDGFKAINDTLGHDAGDRVLIEVARRLRASIRESDFCARLGGDEFACILANLQDPDAVVRVAEKIISAVSQPISLMTGEAVIGASVGIATFRGVGDRPEKLFKVADTYLYEAKHAGKNTYRGAYMPLKEAPAAEAGGDEERDASPSESSPAAQDSASGAMDVAGGE